MMNIATLKQKTMISGMDIAGIGLTVFAGVELSDFIGDAASSAENAEPWFMAWILRAVVVGAWAYAYVIKAKKKDKKESND